MPPTRRGSTRQANNGAAQEVRVPADLNPLYVKDLKLLCKKLKIPQGGGRTALVNRLSRHRDGQTETEESTSSNNNNGDHDGSPSVQPSVNSVLFTSAQVAQIKSIVSSSLQDSIQEAAKAAALAAVKAMNPPAVQPESSSTTIGGVRTEDVEHMLGRGSLAFETSPTSTQQQTSSTAPSTSSDPSIHVPATYVKDIQLDFTQKLLMRKMLALRWTMKMTCPLSNQEGNQSLKTANQLSHLRIHHLVHKHK